MKTNFYIPALLAGLALITSCKPTPRTAVDKNKGEAETTQQQEEQAQEEQEEVVEQAAEQVEAAVDETTAEVEKAAPPTPADLLQQDATRCLVAIASSRQENMLLRPWQKKDVKKSTLMGVYLGDGLVLSTGQAAASAKYVELSLPDNSRTITGRILHYDPDLNLSLLTYADKKDKDFFESRLALPLGEPLKLGDKAEYWGTISGQNPLRIDVDTKKGASQEGMPRLVLQSADGVASQEVFGYPIVADGLLRALSAGYTSSTQSFSAINAELIERFLGYKKGDAMGAPVLGIDINPIDDPVFARFLKLDEGQTGMYVSEVTPNSAAQSAGMQKNDVILSVNGLVIDNQGMVKHPIYGRIEVNTLIRSLLPQGETLQLGVLRKGEQREVPVILDRRAVEESLLPQLRAEETPRYIIHGGLIFQPLSQNYMAELQNAAKGSLPTEYLSLKERLPELVEHGYKELTALTLVIPSPAVLGYEKMGGALVEKVNGKAVHSFNQLADLLDEPTPNGITSITLNKAPYTIYINQQEAAQCNDAIRRSAIPLLRQMEK